MTSFDRPAVWEPTTAYRERSRLARFLVRHELADMPSLVRRSNADPGWYWGAVAAELGITWQTPPLTIMGPVERDRCTWFEGGRYNLASDAIDRWLDDGRGAEIALRWESEYGTEGTWTFDELAREIQRIAAGLRGSGVRTGDRVAVQLPLVPAAVVVTLACARIGAVIVPLFSGFGAASSLERIVHAGARVHVVAESYTRRGRSVDALADANTVRAAAGSPVETTIVVSTGEPVRGAGLTDWSELGGDSDAAAELPAEYPLMLAYTSGTTGQAKGVVLSHAGFALKAGSDAAFCFDLDRGDVASWVTDPGWVMFPITVLGGLLAGAAQALYDGQVDVPDPGRLWRFADRHGVSLLGISPSLVRVLMAHGDDAVPASPPAALRVLASSGEPWTPEAFAWLFERIGRTALPIINYSGGTEVSGAILSNTTIQPIGSCTFATGSPGMGADVVDDECRPAVGAVGELVLRVHSPGMTRGFWNDEERYRETYWSRWPGVWHHGDWARRNTDGTWAILGRSDDTLKLAGKRLGPAEVEAVVNAHPGVAESVAIGVPDVVKGESLVVVVRATAQADLETLPSEVEARLGVGLGRAFRPQRVVVVAALPKTRSGKIVRRLVRAAYLGEDLGDTSSLDEPAILAQIGAVR